MKPIIWYLDNTAEFYLEYPKKENCMISSKAKALYCGDWQISFGHKKSYLLTGYTSEYPICFFNFIVCISAIIEPLENGPLKEREVFQIIKLDNGEEGIITSQTWWGWLVLKVLYLRQKWKMKKDTAEAPGVATRFKNINGKS